MRIESIRAHAFGPFPDRSLELAPGMTAICGPNESGKSTWHAALYAALCGMRRGRGRRSEDSEFVDRHHPWNAANWEVSAIIALEDGRRVELRHDLDGKVDCQARDVDLGRDYSSEIISDGAPDGARWLGLDRRSFLATACVRQADIQTVIDHANSLQEHMQRAAATAGTDSTAAAALSRLDQFHRENVGLDRANSTRPFRTAKNRLQASQVQLDGSRESHIEYARQMAEVEEGFVATEQPAVVRIWQGPGGEPQEQGTRVIVGSKLRPSGRLTEHQTRFLKEHAPGPVKMTVPSPSQFPAISYQPGVTEEFYPTRSDLLWDLASVIKAEINALVNDGVAYIQIDAPRYSYYVDSKWRQHLSDLGEDPDKMFNEAVAADNLCLEGVQRPDLTVALHVCRGNNESKWYAEGGYEPIAEKLFGSLAVDRFLLEYDTDRAGTFEPLRFVPSDKMVVLGLVSSKTARLGIPAELLRRIDEASRYVPVERLALSPQCGFASTAAGNLLTEEEQWRKLELVVETARKVWG